MQSEKTFHLYFYFLCYFGHGFHHVLCAMAESVASRRVTRATSKQNYATQPVTIIWDKFEKPRGHLGKQKSSKDAKGSMDLDDDSFADANVVPAFHTLSATEHRNIGSPNVQIPRRQYLEHRFGRKLQVQIRAQACLQRHWQNSVLAL